jgi:TPR repeat protein
MQEAAVGPCVFPAALGIEPVPISKDLRKQLSLSEDFVGAAIKEVIAGGPADTAGIKPGDIVLSVNDHTIENAPHLIELSNNISGSCDLTVTIRRGGETKDLEVIALSEYALAEDACSAGSASGCFLKGWLTWPDDNDLAIAIYDRACDAGSAQACDYEGHHIAAEGNGAAEAFHLLDRACLMGDPTGCVDLGYAYAVGQGIAKDQNEATIWYERACTLGDALGCYNVGYNRDQTKGVAHDLKEAVAAYKDGCRDGSTSACTELGLLYENGRGVEQDIAHAATLYKKACRDTSYQPRNTKGCVQLGRLYLNGMGVRQDSDRALGVFGDSCNSSPRENDPCVSHYQDAACAIYSNLVDGSDSIHVSEGDTLYSDCND